MKLEACGCEKEFSAKMVVDAVMALGEASHLDMIGIKKVTPGQRCENTGFDATDVLSKLYQKRGQPACLCPLYRHLLARERRVGEKEKPYKSCVG